MHVPHMAGLDLNLALVLHALLAERSVSRAAARLGMSQSAASHALSRLRVALGDPLVVRSPRGVLPTARAEAMAAPLAAGLALLEKTLLAPPPFEPATTIRTFRIATADYAEFVILPPFLRALTREAPQIDTWIRPFAEDPFGALERGDVDLAIGLAGPAGGGPNGYIAGLLDDRLVCVVRSGHPLTRGRLTLTRFAGAKHVLIAPTGRPGGFVDDALAARGLKRQIAVAVPHFLAAPHVVAETDLVLTVASRIAASFATVLPLKFMELPFDLPEVHISMLWHRRQHDDPAHAWVRRRLAETAAHLRSPRRWKKQRRSMKSRVQ
ncbi:MAG TPA: LysR family transcriptional regulator [Polyangiaceae bacterium]|nr:LysR family transcriptional regulator [Polyangiaceae bacterium]